MQGKMGIIIGLFLMSFSLGAKAFLTESKKLGNVFVMNKKITVHVEAIKASLVNEFYKNDPHSGVRLEFPDKDSKNIKYISNTPVSYPSRDDVMYRNEICQLAINTGSQSNDLLVFLFREKENKEVSKQALTDCLDSLKPLLEGKQIEANFFYVK